MADHKRGMPLHTKVFIGMLLGAVSGAIARATWGEGSSTLQFFIKQFTEPIGQLFMKLITMVVIPLLFSALVLGVMEMGNARKIGRVGLRSLIFTIILSSTAVFLAVAGTNLVRPGEGISTERRDQLVALYGDKKKADDSVAKAKEAKTVGETIVGFVPSNPFEEAAKEKLGGALPIMVFALMFGVALASIEAEKSLPVVTFLEGIFAVSQTLVGYAMRLAPFGVCAMIFGVASQLGVDALGALAKYAVLVLVLLAIHMVVTYGLALKIFAKRNPLQFFRQISEVIWTAFGTSSSNATLPVALRVSEESAGIPRSIGNFVLTVGATANQNGTALFEGVTVLFLAPLFGHPLGLTEQFTVVGLAIIAGIGTAGVPGGSYPMIAAILSQVGVPPGAIVLCIGIDRILDMSRTVVNVVGDMVIAACVAKSEEAPMLVGAD